MRLAYASEILRISYVCIQILVVCRLMGVWSLLTSVIGRISEADELLHLLLVLGGRLLRVQLELADRSTRLIKYPCNPKVSAQYTLRGENEVSAQSVDS